MSNEVWVLGEQEDGAWARITFELLTEARRLALTASAELCAISLQGCHEGMAAELGRYGAARVIVVDRSSHAAAGGLEYLDALTELAGVRRPSIFVLGATALGSALAPRLAVRLGAGLASNCTALSVRPDGSLHAVRQVYRRKLQAVVICPEAQSQMATLLPGEVGPVALSTPTTPEVVRVSAGAACSWDAFRVLRRFVPRAAELNLVDAEVVVAGGAGVGGRDGFGILEELADALGGTVGASRVAVDRGWMPRERMVGASGKIVAPRIYVACGISGASMHLGGIKGSELIVAINKDKAAPIFKVAGVRIVGDLHQVVPALIAELQRRRAGQT